MVDEQLRCNICEIVVGTREAEQHASTSSHESRKSKLEQQLKDVSKESYKSDRSVVVQWSSSI